MTSTVTRKISVFHRTFLKLDQISLESIGLEIVVSALAQGGHDVSLFVHAGAISGLAENLGA